MPGFILHLTAARFYLEYLSDSDPLKHSAQLQNDFYVGNLLPDVGKDKAVSHFRDPNFRDRMLEWPKPQWFCQKYLEYMSDPVCCGYWLHLIVDKYFLRDYIPRLDGSVVVDPDVGINDHLGRVFHVDGHSVLDEDAGAGDILAGGSDELDVGSGEGVCD